MKQEEFDQAFRKPAKVYYKGREFEVIAVDWDRKQIGLLNLNYIDHIEWVSIFKVDL